jgi:hypothetical protein
MDVFYKLDIDPSHVIGLYSDLLPSEFINQVSLGYFVKNSHYSLVFNRYFDVTGLLPKEENKGFPN